MPAGWRSRRVCRAAARRRPLAGGRRPVSDEPWMARSERVNIEPTTDGAIVRVDGEVRATFVGDLASAEGVAALQELVGELFGADVPPAIGSMQPRDLT